MRLSASANERSSWGIWAFFALVSLVGERSLCCPSRSAQTADCPCFYFLPNLCLPSKDLKITLYYTIFWPECQYYSVLFNILVKNNGGLGIPKNSENATAAYYYELLNSVIVKVKLCSSRSKVVLIMLPEAVKRYTFTVISSPTESESKNESAAAAEEKE